MARQCLRLCGDLRRHTVREPLDVRPTSATDRHSLCASLWFSAPQLRGTRKQFPRSDIFGEVASRNSNGLAADPIRFGSLLVLLQERARCLRHVRHEPDGSGSGRFPRVWLHDIGAKQPLYLGRHFLRHISHLCTAGTETYRGDWNLALRFPLHSIVWLDANESTQPPKPWD